MNYIEWKLVLLISGITTSLISGIGLLLKEWFVSKMKESIAFEYQKSIEAYKSKIEWDENRKKKAGEISELFSLWLKQNYHKEGNVNHLRYELQKKYWEMALWIDEPILRQINHAIDNSTNPEFKHKDAMVAVRKILLENPEDKITAADFKHFSALD